MRSSLPAWFRLKPGSPGQDRSSRCREAGTLPPRRRIEGGVAQLVRGSSRRIMSMRFRPANIRVINRRVCSSAVIGPAVRTTNAQGSPAGTCSRSAARRSCPAVPERCSTSRVRFAAPNSGAPLTTARRSGQTRDSRRAAPAGTLHGQLAHGSKTEGRLPSCGGKPA